LQKPHQKYKQGFLALVQRTLIFVEIKITNCHSKVQRTEIFVEYKQGFLALVQRTLIFVEINYQLSFKGAAHRNIDS